MGGDFAPKAPIAGALLALAELDANHSIQLVGPTSRVEEQLKELLAGELAQHAAQRDRISIVEAADAVEMSDKPTAVIKRTQSSMHVGLKLQVEGKSDAFVSAGNTGAQMAGSTLMLKLHEGLTRPAISTVLPTAKNDIVLLDSGANVDCSPEELVQFARLGAVYAEDMLGRESPVIGLLSIGEEAEKGNAVVKEANRLLQTAGLNFQGNVEGRDLPAGESDRGPFDVVICDGFVGNVVLKFYESVAPTIIRMVMEAGKVDKQQLLPVFRRLDYSERGGAPLLGVRGVSIISHGKSSPNAIKNAVKVAVRAVESGMSEHIGRRLAATPVSS